MKPQSVEEILSGKQRSKSDHWRAWKPLRLDSGVKSPGVVKRVHEPIYDNQLKVGMGPNATISGSLTVLLVERLADQTPAKVALSAFVLMHCAGQLRMGSASIGDGIGAPQIAGAVRQQASTIHKLLDRLEEADFVCRIPGTRPARMLLNPAFCYKGRSADYAAVLAEWEAGKIERDERRGAMGKSAAGRPAKAADSA
ncbi:MAG: hypothetical protein KUA43_13890 [Hoeflea sp.]|uniref:hypothetical protein n=1 Tax=Hoeflea sp. TaxID=1940281 RepID=UPI001DA0D194|nr:hypothetical protein [Hoeflea sp.]MBU4531250.1 hypothetical protein [Alphaproteobacteria bacterium]MBU4545687.1 hypothetical protein [Alphaproteobacteria bacterium]MBU4550656.1 hypothetical protein [Alphaproteobacteria bacterium]MBV1724527.1 hypothetical protein [Hoeflea sp.]MBV1760547.1 hypothetical protein [Hoeflea sp.]